MPINPITGRQIRANGPTARTKAVRARLRGRTAEGPLASGSKLQVWNGTARHTLGGVHRDGLFQDKHGRIRFRRKSAAAKRNPVFMAHARAAAEAHRFGRGF